MDRDCFNLVVRKIMFDDIQTAQKTKQLIEIHYLDMKYWTFAGAVPCMDPGGAVGRGAAATVVAAARSGVTEQGRSILKSGFCSSHRPVEGWSRRPAPS
uniref:Uncharacterized protein n=1 Tax=Triticum urartu TaxID=4572 RepID=A0A8R7K343_TRIUA